MLNQEIFPALGFHSMVYTVFQFIQGSFKTGFTVELQGKKSFWPETKKKTFPTLTVTGIFKYSQIIH